MTLDKKELHRAYWRWKANYPFLKIDEEVVPYLSEAMTSSDRGTHSWLEKARLSLFLTAESVAQKLGVARNVYWKFEESERRGTIALNTLRKAAEAMDCELIYAIRPKSKDEFSKVIWHQIYGQAMLHPWVKTRPQHLKAFALAAICKIKMNDPEFRRGKNWSARKNVEENNRPGLITDPGV